MTPCSMKILVSALTIKTLRNRCLLQEVALWSLVTLQLLLGISNLHDLFEVFKLDFHDLFEISNLHFHDLFEVFNVGVPHKLRTLGMFIACF